MATRETRTLARFGGFLLALASLVPGPLFAGLRFSPVESREGAETFALSTDAGVLWAATGRGVHRFSGGVWSADGLTGRKVTSLSIGTAGFWAVAGGAVYRRSAAGTYESEGLPAGVTSLSHVAEFGGVLYAGGAGLYKKTATGWTSIGGYETRSITALAPSPGGLLIGFATGGVARFDGTSSQFYTDQSIIAEAVQAVASSPGGILAGTPRGLYLWNGSAWVADTALGLRDVRSIAVSGSVIRVATTSGVMRGGSGVWEAENTGLSTLFALSSLASSAEVYLGTMGGPVYRLSGAAWQSLAGPKASLATSLFVPATLLKGCGNEEGTVVAGFKGAGLLVYPPSLSGPCPETAFSLPPGCADVRAVGAGGTAADLLVATGCGPYFLTETSGSFNRSGIPENGVLTTVTNTNQGIVAGSETDGIFRFVGTSWSPDSNGIPLGQAITATGEAAGSLLAGTTQGLFSRGSTGRWASSQIGIPSSAVVSAIGSFAQTAWAGIASGGVYRRASNGLSWTKDSYGVNAAPIFQFAAGGGAFAAAAGTTGPAVRSEGGWQGETLGLPAGADVRSVAITNVVKGTKNPKTFRRLYAGTAGHGLFVANLLPATRVLPVVLDLEGAASSRYRTELTLGNRSEKSITLDLTFSPAPGFGAPALQPGAVRQVLSPKSEIRIADVVSFLRDGGLPIPPTPQNRIAGSLSIAGTYPDDPDGALENVYAIARTYTRDAKGGSFGLFYGAPSDLETAEESATVYGLRREPGVSRSNLAVVHVPGRENAPIAVEIQVYGALGQPTGEPLSKSLEPGEWYQWNDILGLAGLPEGSYGYARIRRVAGTGSFTAYGVVNDAITSDGSYLPAFRPGGLAAVRRQVVPVVLDVVGDRRARFTTELTLVNGTSTATLVDLAYQPAPGYGQDSAGGPIISVNLAAGEQRTIGNILQFLRENGFFIPDPETGGPQAGTLTVDFRFARTIDAGDTLALARTTTPNPDAEAGGRFGLFYRGFAEGAGARTAAVVPALVQNSAYRSNLAVVHASGGSDDELVLSVQLYRAETGAPIGNPLTVTIYAGDWFQWNKVIEAADVTEENVNAFARITRVSGDDTFFAYGVVNDNLTSDGSYVEMIPDGN